jgi:hypothetical protein
VINFMHTPLQWFATETTQAFLFSKQLLNNFLQPNLSPVWRYLSEDRGTLYYERPKLSKCRLLKTSSTLSNIFRSIHISTPMLLRPFES